MENQNNAPANLKFDELPLSAEVQKALVEMGFTEASPIQTQAIPVLMAGRDLIGQAQTGTGKTAAFGIPAIESIDELNPAVQALVLCPTRELALQVSEELKKIARFKRGIQVAAIYGGESIERQIKALRGGVQIVVGTPGRVIDHLERRTLRLDSVRTVVLDEADEMLDMGFRDDIEVILSRVPEERQTVFFSATMSKDILALTKRYQQDPAMVKIHKSELTTPNIEQFYYEIRGKQKAEAFCRLVEYYDLKLMLVFCNTKRMVDELVEELNGKGYEAEGLHGDLRQTQRNNVMSKFRGGATTILVATDVAARGIDVDNVDAVFNYDLPMDDEYYVHRIGRTARAGRSGKSFSFITGKDMVRLKDIMRYTKANIKRGDIPTAKEIIEIRKTRFAAKVTEQIAKGETDNYKDIVEELVNSGHELPDIAAALVAMNLGELKMEEFSSVGATYDRGPRSERPERYERGERSFDRPGADRSDRYDRGGDRTERTRTERSPRPEHAAADSNMVRLFINIGRQSKVRPGDIVGAIAGETKIPGNKIGAIDIFDKFSFVDIPTDFVSEVISVMDNNQIKGKKINIEIAR